MVVVACVCFKENIGNAATRLLAPAKADKPRTLAGRDAGLRAGSMHSACHKCGQVRPSRSLAAWARPPSCRACAR